MTYKAKKILDFWFKETPPKKRFQKHKDFDKLIRDKFLKDYELASNQMSMMIGKIAQLRLFSSNYFI